MKIYLGKNLFNNLAPVHTLTLPFILFNCMKSLFLLSKSNKSSVLEATSKTLTLPYLNKAPTSGRCPYLKTPPPRSFLYPKS